MAHDLDRRHFMKGTVGGAAAVGLAGCLGDGDPADGDDTGDVDDADDGESETDVPRTNTLYIAQSEAPDHWDPVEQMTAHGLMVASQIYTDLYTYDEGIGLVPSELTTGMPEEERDGERYIVEIVDYAEFHNGDPVTAEDVVYTYQAPIDEGTRMAGEFEMIETIETVDDTTVQFDLSHPYGAFPVQLSHQVTPKNAREEDPDGFRFETPIGSGPYRFVDWQEGEYATIERWDDYWGDLDPHVQEVEFVPVEEDSTRITTLETGEYDMVEGIPASLWDTAEGLENAAIQSEVAMNFNYFHFNTNEGPPSDKRVREAIDYCIDIDQAVENFVEPAGSRLYSPANELFQEEWDFPREDWMEYSYPRDIDRASELFDEAGVPDDYEFIIVCPPDDVREEISVSMANGIEEAGYNAQVQRLGWSAFIDTNRTGDEDDCNVYIVGTAASPNMPSVLRGRWSYEFAGVNNGIYYQNEEFEEMMEQAEREPDRDVQRQLMIDIIDHALEAKIVLPTHGLLNSWGVGDHVHDMQVHTLNQLNPRLVSEYNNVWVE